MPPPSFAEFEADIDRFACIRRGEFKGQLKCECGSGKERWVDTFACSSPRMRERLCIVAGTITLEPERHWYAVCQRCREREPPPA